MSLRRVIDGCLTACSGYRGTVLHVHLLNLRGGWIDAWDRRIWDDVGLKRPSETFEVHASHPLLRRLDEDEDGGGGVGLKSV